MIREKELHPPSGITFLVFLVPAFLGSVAMLVLAARSGQVAPTVACALLVLFLGGLFGGLFVVNPNEAKVLQLFGKYVGSAKEPGLRWANPFCMKKKVSLRAVSFESGKLKVNDLDGNPVEIATIVVWKVVDSAEQLQAEVQDRVKAAGVQVLEARISHLAYAPEIAQAMLQRQQASAIIAARQKIVDGAVGMVEMALARLDANNVVKLDDERKAAMVSNLLVVLCSERSTQPIVNTGSIYH